MRPAITEFEWIYKRCFPRAMGLAVSLLHDEEEARDVVQEVFAKLWQTEPVVQNPDAFLYRSVRNACINHIEMTEIREKIKKLYPIEMESADRMTEQRLADVQKALALLLSAREQEVVNEIFSKGNSYKVAADNLGISVSAVNKYIVSALKKLRNHFNPRRS